MLKVDASSSADLLRACGESPRSRHLWDEFQGRFQKLILLYLLRACLASRGHQEEMREVLADLSQEVYLRLVQHDGRVLQSFEGKTEFSARAFLSRIAMSVVADHFRMQAASKRRANVISIDDAPLVEDAHAGGTGLTSKTERRVLDQVDLDRLLRRHEHRTNGTRDLVIFRLHHIDGFTASELAQFPAFKLTESGVETVLSRLRQRIRHLAGARSATGTR